MLVRLYNGIYECENIEFNIDDNNTIIGSIFCRDKNYSYYNKTICNISPKMYKSYNQIRNDWKLVRKFMENKVEFISNVCCCFINELGFIDLPETLNKVRKDYATIPLKFKRVSDSIMDFKFPEVYYTSLTFNSKCYITALYNSSEANSKKNNKQSKIICDYIFREEDVDVDTESTEMYIKPDSPIVLIVFEDNTEYGPSYDDLEILTDKKSVIEHLYKNSNKYYFVASIYDVFREGIYGRLGDKKLC